MESLRNILLARFAVVLLVTALGVALWQGYGPWLVSLVRAHVG